MSRLQKKVIPSEDERVKLLVKRHSRVYYKRLGKYRYVVVFPMLPGIPPYKQGLFINAENNGIFNRVIESEVNGTLLEYEDIPELILNLIKRELYHGGYL